MSLDHLERRLQRAARELRDVRVDTPPLHVGAEPDLPSGRVAHKVLVLAAPIVVALAILAVVLAASPNRAAEPIAVEPAESAAPIAAASATSDDSDVFAASADRVAAASDEGRGSSDPVATESRVETRAERAIEPAFGVNLPPRSEMDAERLASKLAGSPAAVAPPRPLSAMAEKLLVSGLA